MFLDEEKRELVFKWCRVGGTIAQRCAVEDEAGVLRDSLVEWALDRRVIRLTPSNKSEPTTER